MRFAGHGKSASRRAKEARLYLSVPIVCIFLSFIFFLLIRELQYRAGTIEEKIFQRQITKQGLATSVVDENTDAATQFTLDDLKDLFKLRMNTLCETHDLLECNCCVTKLGGDDDEDMVTYPWPFYLGTKMYHNLNNRKSLREKDFL